MKLRRGVTSPVRDLTTDRCDFVIVRENTEGLYAGGGVTAHAGTAEAVAVHTSVTTASATEAVVRHAFELAGRRRKRLTLCHKTNILVDAGRLWQQTVDRLSAEYDDVDVDYAHADAMCLHLIARPEQYDVIVTDNLFGDILSDLGAAIQGGLGTAASGNINLDGSAPEHVRARPRSAPDIAGTSRADPTAMLLSVAMMLESLGLSEAAAACEGAVEAALVHHSEGMEPMHTARFGDLVVDLLRSA